MRFQKIRQSVFITTLIIIALVSFLFRFKGIVDNHPFWVDEYSSAHQARYILTHGLNVFNSINKPPIYFEDRNITAHFLIAFSFKLFGQQEWAARLPMVFIGSLVPVLFMILASHIFNKRVAIVTGLLMATSYYEIVWSRQARGYIIQQFLIALTIIIYLKLMNQKTKRTTHVFYLAVSVILGLLTHPLFLLLLLSMAVHYILTHNFKEILTLWKKPVTYIVAICLLFVVIKLGVFNSVLSSLGKVNNVWYYHSFLWREYGLLTFLAILGIFTALIQRPKPTLLIALFIFLNISYLCFLLGPYISRYLNPIFPFIILFAAFFITHSVDSIKKPRLLHSAAPFLFALFIIGNGYKFDVKPNSFYSVNHDFREIALIDYHQIYNHIKTLGDFRNHQTAIIETWPDRLHWYMGQDYYDAYEFKWKLKSVTNGITTSGTPYYINEKGEKMTQRYKKIGYIDELSDLKKAMRRYPKGFLFIDDATLPQDVITYANNNLKKELYLDHYPLDDNPYSIWPATLYSWGIQ